MKVQNKTIIAITAATALFAGSASADDVATALSFEQGSASVSIGNQNSVNPKVTIQDYIDSANRENTTNYVVDTRSRWEAEQAL